MNDYLKHYKVKILALSPIFIGSGKKISKKEYIYMPWNHCVIVPDVEKMYTALQRKNLTQGFQDYILRQGNYAPSLGEWLGKNGFKEKDYDAWKRYEMDAGEAFLTKGTARPKEIEAFVKDSYELPYVPGSSIKGMFRTALLAWEIQKNPRRYEKEKNELARNARAGGKRNIYLLRDMKNLEFQTFGTLHADDTRNMVNDNMRGIRVSDSAPISLDQLTLCQKIDYTLDGVSKPLPILRESLIPGTKIFFDVTIDTELSPYTMEDIIEALNTFHQISDKYFYSRFHKTRPEKDIIWLGGGCGFLSKTILYPMFGNDAVRVADSVYQSTLGKLYNVHKHSKDIHLNLAPHVCKCTKYRGELYDIGKGKIEYREE